MTFTVKHRRNKYPVKFKRRTKKRLHTDTTLQKSLKKEGERLLWDQVWLNANSVSSLSEMEAALTQYVSELPSLSNFVNKKQFFYYLARYDHIAIIRNCLKPIEFKVLYEGPKRIELLKPSGLPEFEILVEKAIMILAYRLQNIFAGDDVSKHHITVLQQSLKTSLPEPSVLELQEALLNYVTNNCGRSEKGLKILKEQYQLSDYESVSCLFVDFLDWGLLNKDLSGPDFVKARDTIYEDYRCCSANTLRLSVHPEDNPQIEIGYLNGINNGLSYALSLRQLTAKNIIDLQYRLMAPINIKKTGFAKGRCRFQLADGSNLSDIGWDELREEYRVIGWVNRIAELIMYDSNPKPIIAYYQGAWYLFGYKNIGYEKIMQVLNYRLHLLDIELAKASGCAEQKLQVIVKFICWFERHHFFRDGNIRTSLCLFYHLLYKHQLEMTIMSNPNIFDGFSQQEIIDDLIKGQLRYKKLCQGRHKELIDEARKLLQ